MTHPPSFSGEPVGKGEPPFGSPHETTAWATFSSTSAAAPGPTPVFTLHRQLLS